MGQKLYVVLLDLEFNNEYKVLSLTTDKEWAEHQASLSPEYRKVAIMGEMLEERE